MYKSDIEGQSLGIWKQKSMTSTYLQKNSVCLHSLSECIFTLFLEGTHLQCLCQSVFQKMLADFNRIWQLGRILNFPSFCKLQKNWWLARKREWSKVFLCTGETEAGMQQDLQPTRQLVIVSVRTACCVLPCWVASCIPWWRAERNQSSWYYRDQGKVEGEVTGDTSRKWKLLWSDPCERDRA